MNLLVQYIIPIIYTSGLVTIILFCAVCSAFLLCFYYFLVFWVGRRIKTFRPEVWRRQWHPTPVLLPGKSHGWRSLVGCSPWGRKESDVTGWLHFHFSLSCIGEGNGNPLQCSCLENPRDREPGGLQSMGSQSRTRLKWLSSSSSSSSSLNREQWPWLMAQKILASIIFSFLLVCLVLFSSLVTF